MNINLERNMYLVVKNLQGEACIVTIPYSMFEDESKSNLSDKLNLGSIESVEYFSEDIEKCEKYIVDNGLKRITRTESFRFYKYDFDIEINNMDDTEFSLPRIMAYEKYESK